MSQEIIIGGVLVVAFLALWWTTSRIGQRDRGKQPSAMARENSELRHIVMEMSKDKHRQRDDGQDGR